MVRKQSSLIITPEWEYGAAGAMILRSAWK